jgi:hypothetical protein
MPTLENKKKLKASAYLNQRTARYNTGKNISDNSTIGE